MFTNKFKDFKSASKYIQSIYSLADINYAWNRTGKGKPAIPATTKRWLNNGPKTKNPRFEPWIEKWAEREWLNSTTLDVIAKELDVTRERVRQLQLRHIRSSKE